MISERAMRRSLGLETRMEPALCEDTVVYLNVIGATGKRFVYAHIALTPFATLAEIEARQAARAEGFTPLDTVLIRK